MDFVSLRLYLESGGRPLQHGDSTTLSTCSDELTAVVSPSNPCSFEDSNQYCNVFDSIQSFTEDEPMNPSPNKTTTPRGSIRIVSTVASSSDSSNNKDLPVVEPKLPRAREAGEVMQLEPAIMYAKPPSSTNDTKKHVTEPKTHWRMWGHGKIPTFIALLLAWSGCFCAVACRSSTDFAILREPFFVSPMYDPLTRVGMIRMKLCFNETMSDMEGCEVIRLSPPEVEDRMFNIARSLLTLATCLGAGLTLVLTTAVGWESINLRPLGFAFVLTYLLQSFSLFFFGSKLCHQFRCKMSQGSILCVVTSLLWIGVSFAVFKMDVFKMKAKRERSREARRKRRRERRQAIERQEREQELAQMTTAGSTDTDESAPVADIDLEEASISTAEAVIGSPQRKK